MTNLEDAWRVKSDEEIIAAAQEIEDYTDKGRRVILAEMERRGLKVPPPVEKGPPKPHDPDTRCPECGAVVSVNILGDALVGTCTTCGIPVVVPMEEEGPDGDVEDVLEDDAAPASVTDCPFCGEAIDVMHARFECPACGHVDPVWNIGKNCDYCRFSPHFITCPHCDVEFSFMSLIGDFRDRTGGVLAPEPKRKCGDEYSYRVGDLAVQYHKTSFDLDLFLKEVPEEEADALLEAHFTFPFPVGRIAIHTVYASDDGRRWLHVWVYSAGEGGEPYGQLSFACPRPRTGATEGGGWQCIAKEVFFPPAG